MKFLIALVFLIFSVYVNANCRNTHCPSDFGCHDVSANITACLPIHNRCERYQCPIGSHCFDGNSGPKCYPNDHYPQLCPVTICSTGFVCRTVRGNPTCLRVGNPLPTPTPHQCSTCDDLPCSAIGLVCELRPNPLCPQRFALRTSEPCCATIPHCVAASTTSTSTTGTSTTGTSTTGTSTTGTSTTAPTTSTTGTSTTGTSTTGTSTTAPTTSTTGTSTTGTSTTGTSTTGTSTTGTSTTAPTTSTTGTSTTGTSTTGTSTTAPTTSTTGTSTTGTSTTGTSTTGTTTTTTA